MTHEIDRDQQRVWPLVSIITPSFNSAPYIEATITSVRDQTYSNWEQIIVDDCSTDGTWQMAEASAKADPRVIAVRQDKNAGPGPARNRAMAMARGRFIAFLDSDDIWKPKKLEKQIAFMLETGAPFTYTNYDIINESGDPVGQQMAPPILRYRDLLKTCDIGCLTVVLDRQRLGQIVMPTIPKGQDYALWLQLLKSIDSAKGLSEHLAVYRRRTSSVSSNKLAKAAHQWRIYRDIEHLSIHKACFFFVHYMLHGVKKRYF